MKVLVIQLRKRLREVMLLSSCSSFLETNIRGEPSRIKALQIKGVQEVQRTAKPLCHLCEALKV